MFRQGLNHVTVTVTVFARSRQTRITPTCRPCGVVACMQLTTMHANQQHYFAQGTFVHFERPMASTHAQFPVLKHECMYKKDTTERQQHRQHQPKQAASSPFHFLLCLLSSARLSQSVQPWHCMNLNRLPVDRPLPLLLPRLQSRLLWCL